ncbi:MAG TPA: electron transfer flavoprotein subunit beta/FixA family protein [Acidimicrobiales bacterium]|nr:electron transfer flavoprotein subunit beta/FixA family protein [Acidimicrobiales bacterium]
MRVFVTVKHVPDTTEVRFGPDGSLLVDRAPTKINDYDRNALEAAAQLREGGAEVVIGCVGPPEATKTLKEALAFGAEHAVLVSGTWARSIDSATTARVLAALARHEGPFDLFVSGDVSEDGYDGLVPGLLASEMGVPLLRGVHSMIVDSATVVASRALEDANEEWQLDLPAALSVTRLLNAPRTITTMQVMKVPMSRVRTISAGELGIDEASLDEAAHTVRTLEVRPAAQGRHNEMLAGSPAEVVHELLTRLEAMGVLT